MWAGSAMASPTLLLILSENEGGPAQGRFGKNLAPALTMIMTRGSRSWLSELYRCWPGHVARTQHFRNNSRSQFAAYGAP